MRLPDTDGTTPTVAPRGAELLEPATAPERPDGPPETQPSEPAAPKQPPDGELLRAVEEQARRVQAYARDLADLIALGRAVARESDPLPHVAAPLLDRVPRDVLAELLATGRQLEAATEATFEGAGRGDRRASLRQHADLFVQREVSP